MRGTTGPDLDALIQRRIASGRNHHPDNALAESLDRLEELGREQAAHHAPLVPEEEHAASEGVINWSPGYKDRCFKEVRADNRMYAAVAHFDQERDQVGYGPYREGMTRP